MTLLEALKLCLQLCILSPHHVNHHVFVLQELLLLVELLLETHLGGLVLQDVLFKEFDSSEELLFLLLLVR